jgi:PBSX family phage terminase large subunit
MSGRRFTFCGDNAHAYLSEEPEVLLAGAAGTGKTLMWLAKCLKVCDQFPGARVLIVRKTRESMTESVLVTLERDILGPSHPVLTKNPTLRRIRQSYRFPNRSEIVVGGLDKPDKILSSEWDMIYAAEATELTLTDWETLGSRLRSGIAPWQQLAADCNPGPPFHWLYKRQSAGLMRMYTSKHSDNPRFFDKATQQWTIAGVQYLDRLGRMTGARRKRFLEGVWAVAEGLVYDGYDPAIHHKPRGWQAPKDWRRLWSIDWGFTAPLVLQMWALDGDGRMYLTRELYVTRWRVDRVAQWAKDLIDTGFEQRPEAIVCDHDPENASTFAAVSGLRVTMADKTDRDKGIQQVQQRFDVQEDNQPRIYFVDGCRHNDADPDLLAEGKPTCTTEELLGYTWKPDAEKDEPIELNDHSCDSLRYACRWADTHQAGDLAAIWAANEANMHASPYGALRPGTFRG